MVKFLAKMYLGSGLFAIILNLMDAKTFDGFLSGGAAHMIVGGIIYLLYLTNEKEQKHPKKS